MEKLRITCKDIKIFAEITEENSETAEKILKALPIKGIVNTWGEEIYFSTSLNLKEENLNETVELGDIAYWPPGKAICLFFGKTPVSDDKIRPASPVNVFAKIKGDPKVLKRIKSGEKIIIEK